MKDKDTDKSKFRSLNIEYFKYRTLFTEKFLNRKPYVEKDPKKVLAFIPGTIRKVEVQPGDIVKKGDMLLTLEAMKMKNRILAPMDAKVKEVFVSPGVNVPKNHLLLELE